MASQLIEYLFEMGHLKRVPRSGWSLAGIADPESVADHSFRTAVIAYLLAALEGADPEKAAAMALFHDAAETRLNDLHRLGKAYVDWPAVEESVLADQWKALPPKLKERLVELSHETREQTCPEALVVEDADRLECLLQAREYSVCGYDVDEWIRSSAASLSTDAAKEIASEALRASPGGWRQTPGES